MSRRFFGRRKSLRLGSPAARRYAIWIGSFLFLYSVLIFGIAFLVPYVPAAAMIVSSMPLADRAAAADRFLMLGEVFPPVCAALLIGAGLFSVNFAKRIAGPLFRLESFANELAKGRISARIRLRNGDELRALGNSLNDAMASLDATASEIRERQVQAREAVAGALDSLRSGDPTAEDRLEAALKQMDAIGESFEHLHLSDPT